MTDICAKLRMALEKLVTNQAIKMNTDPEPLVLVEPNVLEELRSEVVELESEPKLDNAAKPEPEPEIRKPLVETSADLLAELAMKVVPPRLSCTILCRSSYKRHHHRKSGYSWYKV